jgi:cytochrome c oxidase cbb3-type subunit 3
MGTAQSTKPAVQAPSAVRQNEKPEAQAYPTVQVENGQALFLERCAFCHGRDAGGGETGPDLTRSKVVADDVHGDQIGPVVRNGRPEKGMPRFSFSDTETASLVAFIHTAKTKAESQIGKRRGVDPEDLQTGNAQAGQRYFAKECARCHSPSGDLAGVASRYQGLRLEQRMLYPSKAKAQATVTLPSGESISGTLAYLDEFTIAVRDAEGFYRSWAIKNVKYSVNAPAEEHADLLGKYTDDDIHNLMAYLQTLK